ncbi:MAG: hypothetical protein M1838_004682 [Thelocarpon superellum]|nr:MAG: hypothetical protein M1838_004682 [Thelocarpon superellum]
MTTMQALSQAQSYRKIELQSAEDLRFLIANVKRAAYQKLDLNFPPSAAVLDDDEGVADAGKRGRGNGNVKGKEDALRRRVEDLVLDYVRQTFEYAYANITVNGLPAPSLFPSKASTRDGTAGKGSEVDDEVEIEYEPFDTELATRVQGLHASIESLTLSTTSLRRTAPADAAAAFKERFATLLEEDEAIVAAMRPPSTSALSSSAAPSSTRIATEAGARKDKGHGTEMEVEVDMAVEKIQAALPRQREMEQTWAGAVTGLVALKDTLPGTVAKLERAERAVEYLGGAEGS